MSPGLEITSRIQEDWLSDHFKLFLSVKVADEVTVLF